MPKDLILTHQLIEEQVSISPDADAIILNDQRISYRRMNNLANHLALLLQEQGIRPDTYIGIFLDNSIEMLIGVLAVLKAGGAFIPIELNYSDDRINYLIEDAEPIVILTTQNLAHRIPNQYLSTIILVDGLLRESGVESNPQSIIDLENLVYLGLTSGSTGRPKGVMVTQRGLSNYLMWAREYYSPNIPANFPFYTSLAFDLTITSLFLPLITGGYIYIFKDRPLRELVELTEVNFLKITPANLSLIKSSISPSSGIRKIIVGGEGLKTALARQVYEAYQKSIQIFNEYGPTETVVGSLVYEYHSDDTYPSVLIGKPISNTGVYILDDELNPVKEMEVGELYITGMGVTKGYLKRVEETRAAYLPDLSGIEQMYKTGDLVRRLEDGNIEYLGRIGVPETGYQNAGYPVRIDEIENCLFNHPQIKDVVVVIMTCGKHEGKMAAYFISDIELSLTNLRGYLKKVLPEYKIPSIFIHLEKIPLNSNGKVYRPELRQRIKSGFEGSI